MNDNSQEQPEIDVRTNSDECGHDHSGDPLAGLACVSSRAIHEASPSSPVAVIILEDLGKHYDPKVSLVSTMTSTFVMVKALLEIAEQIGRPTDCVDCANAHDAMMLALSTLKAARAANAKHC